ncbi:hypothetical protein FA13DRAFT_1709457 [Coprinellus micaceus]|uniref:CxC2-like cysteine cluster KDZ transposase-associated domain-containing protein n=1 Tax=Coprinellus micaceus TaxID=71717 RepID=A0A4Y7TDK2_COPMI|nr:hypothetical protein FA13DRAFT_1709457 [Coprinellus micaceus]
MIDRGPPPPVNYTTKPGAQAFDASGGTGVLGARSGQKLQSSVQGHSPSRPAHAPAYTPQGWQKTSTQRSSLRSSSSTPTTPTRNRQMRPNIAHLPAAGSITVHAHEVHIHCSASPVGTLPVYTVPDTPSPPSSPSLPGSPLLPSPSPSPPPPVDPELWLCNQVVRPDSPEARGTKFYIVTSGRVCGIFSEWIFVEQSVRDYKSKGAAWQSKTNYTQALQLWRRARNGAKVIGRVDGDEDDSSPLVILLDSLAVVTQTYAMTKGKRKLSDAAIQPRKRAANAASSFRCSTAQPTTSGKAATTKSRIVFMNSKAKENRTFSTSIRLGQQVNGSNMGNSNLCDDETSQQASDTTNEASSDTNSKKSPPKNKRRTRAYGNRARLQEWLPYRYLFLDELLRRDSFCDSEKTDTCTSCNATDCKLYRCTTCGDGLHVVCDACIVEKHWNLPLHTIEVGVLILSADAFDNRLLALRQQWNGKFFDKATLIDLGLEVHLGHGGRTCPNPKNGPKDFRVFDTSGVHRVSIFYCGCTPLTKEQRLQQLLRAGWFPGTVTRPQTVFTMDLLDMFHELTLQSKTTLYDFYHTIIQRADKLQLGKIPDGTGQSRCNNLQRVFRIYRALILLKQGARGHSPNGIDSTKAGELALECPACPHPGKNLPDNWATATTLAFLYTLFVALDANFKLKGKACRLQDIELMPGWAFCVEDGPYQDHLQNYKDEKESEHDAIMRAAIRHTPGYDVTGAGVVICSRHGLIRPNGVGDLQKGERRSRYCNMDYIILSALVAAAVLRIVITYDIACQWHRNLPSQVERYPEHMRISPDVNVQCAVLSWHLNGHGPTCQTDFALAYKEGMGRTCGDEIEGSFLHTNSLGSSFREMAPAGRHEALNGTYSGYNLLKILVNAISMKAKHTANYLKLTSSFNEEDLKIVETWTAEIVAWEADKSKRNPYKEPEMSTTLQDVRLELTKEEAEEKKTADKAKARGQRGNAVETGQIDDSEPVQSLSSFIVQGLEIEEQQRVLALEKKGAKSNSTSKQQTDVIDKCNTLYRRILNWRKVQLSHQPNLVSLISTTTEEGGESAMSNPESIPLHLPSGVMADNKLRVCPKVSDVEQRLRIAQADDALSEIRRLRRIVTWLWQFKSLQLSGEGNRPNTRLRVTHTRLQNRIMR